MQASIHPTENLIKVICTCGNKFSIVSSIAKDKMHIEMCFKCHPAYTGKRKISKKGAVEQFERKFKAYNKTISKNQTKDE